MKPMSEQDTSTVAVNVQIFGREYPVACPEGEEQALLQSARLVDSEMRKVRQHGKVVGTDRIAVMVSLNLAHELMLTRARQHGHVTADNADNSDTGNNADQQRLHQLNQQIDKALRQYQSYLPE